MSAECNIHGTDLLYDESGMPNYCPSCELDELKGTMANSTNEEIRDAPKYVDAMLPTPRYISRLEERTQEYSNFADLLIDDFEDRVYGLLNDILLTHPYAGLTHFRDNILAPSISNTLGYYMTKIILDRMIETGKIDIVKRQEAGRDYAISTLVKGESNGATIRGDS